MTTHYPTCEICAPLQGRVYSISGKDKRFPPLSQAFKNGYHNVHPNCRHSVHAWIEDLQDPEELQQALDDGGKPFEDLRPEEEKKLYNEQQSQNRRARDDRRQYERYKERLGEDAPKTFSAFRRMKKAGGERWEDLQYYYRYKGDRPTYCVKIDRDLEKLGITEKGKAFPADNAFEVKSWRVHATNKLTASGLGKDVALSWKNGAKIAFRHYPEPNTLLNYYHEDGIIEIKKIDGRVQTIVTPADFGSRTIAILEAIQKHVK